MALPLTLARAQQGSAASHVLPTPAGSLPLTLDVDVTLARLHPGASQGSLECGAIVRPGDWVALHRGEITDYASAAKLVLSPAHYLGQSGSAPFALERGGLYRGGVRFATALTQAALTDPANHAPWSPQPTALLVCWLTLNGHAAVWDPSAAPRVAAAENTAFVATSPLVVAVQDLSAAGVSAKATLHAQGNYFVPGAVAVAAQAGGRHAAAAAPATAAVPANQTGQSGNANPTQSQASLNPQPISLQVGFNAAAAFQTPQAQSIQVQLTAGGSFTVPAAASVGASLAASGAFTVPAPLGLSLTMQSGGAFVVPAPISTGLTLQAAGPFPPPAH